MPDYREAQSKLEEAGVHLDTARGHGAMGNAGREREALADFRRAIVAARRATAASAGVPARREG